MSDNEKKTSMVRRDSFVGEEVQAMPETAAMATAAQARAAVEARYVMARQFPRDMDTVRQRVLRDCRRPRFAEVARYSKPVGGKKIIGPSIRFAEAALRATGNTLQENLVIYDDTDKRIRRIMVTDLETNETYTQDIVVTKTVERRHLRRGQQPISKRTNSNGETVYLVNASDDDMKTKEGAMSSIALRTCALRLIPGDLIEESMDAVVATIQNDAAEDPDRARKKIADAFAQLSITPTDLAEYLGHELGKCSPAELVDLRSVYATVRDGETTWPEVLSQQRDERGEQTSADPTTTGTRGVKDRIKAKAAKAKPQAKTGPQPCAGCGDAEVDGEGVLCAKCDGSEPEWMARGAQDRE